MGVSPEDLTTDHVDENGFVRLILLQRATVRTCFSVFGWTKINERRTRAKNAWQSDEICRRKR
jgi:hypothetical protein